MININIGQNITANKWRLSAMETLPPPKPDSNPAKNQKEIKSAMETPKWNSEKRNLILTIVILVIFYLYEV